MARLKQYLLVGMLIIAALPARAEDRIAEPAETQPVQSESGPGRRLWRTTHSLREKVRSLKDDAGLAEDRASDADDRFPDPGSGPGEAPLALLSASAEQPAPPALLEPAGRAVFLNAAASGIEEDLVIDALQLKDMDIMDVFQLLSEKSGLNIIAGQGISGRVTIFLKAVRLKDVLRIILDANNLAYAVEDSVVHVMPAADFERRYGYAFGGDIRTKMVSLVYAQAADAEAMLSRIKSPQGKIIAESKSNTLILMDTPVQLELMQKMLARIDVPVETRVFELSYAKVKDLGEKIGASIISSSGSVRYDERANVLFVTDVAQRLELVDKFIKALDKKQEQVLIEAKIVQVILNDENKLGIDWAAVVKKYHNLTLKSDFDILSSSDKSGTLSIGTLEDDNYTALIQALSTVGNSDILASPRIATLNDQEAKILVGSTEPYVTSTTTTPASGPSTVSEEVNFIDVGVKLYVTPHIHKDGFITMTLRPEVSSVTRTLPTSTNNSIPVVDTAEAETTVTVKDGVTIVIGGLIKEETITTVNKVPFLGDIPLVKYAFRNSADMKRKTEIVLFLTPRIVTGDVSAETIPSAR